MRSPALLHSVSYSGSWGQAFLTPEQVVDKAAELGFNGVLFMAKRPHVSLLDYGPAERLRLRQLLERRGIQKAGIAAYNNFTADLNHPGTPMVEMQVHHTVELARLASDLGGDLVRVFTGYEHPATDYGKQWDLVVRALKECARRTADLGVTVGVQNHHDIGVGFEAQRDLIQAVGEPNCRALFDAWAPALHGTDIIEAARVMAPLTAHTTIANYRKQARYRYQENILNYEPLQPVLQAMPVDEGFIDYRQFLRALWDAGFQGTVAYEMCSPIAGGGSLENLDRYARRFVEWLHEVEDRPEVAR